MNQMTEDYSKLSVEELIEKARVEEWEELDLSDRHLKDIPKSVFKLQNLTFLALNFNELNHIPTNIKNLINLQTLDISYNLISSLPAEIVELNKIINIDLSANSFSTFPDEIISLTTLCKIDLRENELKTIPSSIKKLKELIALNFSDNSIEQIPSSLFTLHKLEELNLSNNNINIVSAEIGNLVNLKKLSLYDNYIQDLPSSLGKLQKLLHLDVQGNFISNIPIQTGDLKNLEELDIAENRITTIPIELSNLINLKKLYLYNNKITHLPDYLSSLKNLVHLEIQNTGLKKIPKWISDLKEIQTLDISNNNITEIDSSICELHHLESLWASNNKITSLPFSLTQLKKIETLRVSNNNITLIPNWIDQISSLVDLDLSKNPISDIPFSISKLRRLTELSIGHHTLSKIPSFVFSLHSLEGLSITNSSIKNIPSYIDNLQNLNRLNLSNNYLSSLPKSIVNLKRLNRLYLNSNNFKEIPNCLTKMSRIFIINMRNNDISHLSNDICTSRNLIRLLLDGNPISIPPEIIKTGSARKIFNFWLKAQTDSRPLNQGKMLLVGQGGVGKTSLVKRLLQDDFNEKELMTEGINISDWKINLGKTEITSKVWDFGGQEVMHATHQFFLTERSLYLLVWDARQEDTYGQVEYWLKTIQSFGGNSPILVISNKTDDGGAKELGEKALARKYPSIKGFHKISCKNGTGIDDLKTHIRSIYENMPHVRELWPASWFNTKKKLENQTSDHIPFSDYKRICNEETVSEFEHKHLIEFLHDLGIVLCFRGDHRLCDTAVLNPEWVTGGVYKILNSSNAKALNGNLSVENIKEILSSEKGYKDKEIFIIDMMSKFELCFETEEKDHYLIPELLQTNEPEFDWDEETSPVLQYQYKILPPSIISRFIVRMHDSIYLKTYWKNGVVLSSNDGKNKALVRSDLTDKTLSIYIDGPIETRRDFIAQIRGNLGTIHKSFQELETDERVPVPDHPKVSVSYSHLQKLENMGMTEFPPEGMDGTINVKALLDGVRPDASKYKRELTNLLAELKRYAPEHEEDISQLFMELEQKKSDTHKSKSGDDDGTFNKVTGVLKSVQEGIKTTDKGIGLVLKIHKTVEFVRGLGLI